MKPHCPSLLLQVEDLKSAQMTAMTEILGALEAATGDVDKLKHILGEDAAKTKKPDEEEGKNN